MKTFSLSNIFVLTMVLMTPVVAFAGAVEIDPYQEVFEQEAKDAAMHAEQLKQETKRIEEENKKGLWPWLNTHQSPTVEDAMNEGPLVPMETSQGTTMSMHSSAGKDPISGWWWPLVALAGLFGLAWFGTGSVEEAAFSEETFGVSSHQYYGPPTKQEAIAMKSVSNVSAGACGVGAGSCLAGVMDKASCGHTHKETYELQAIIFNCHSCGDEHAIDAHCKQCNEVAARAMGVPNQDVEAVACEGCGHSFSPTCEACRRVLQS